MTKICDFWYPIYDRCGWQNRSCEGLLLTVKITNSDERVASFKFKLTYPIQEYSANTMPYLRPKWPEMIPCLTEQNG